MSLPDGGNPESPNELSTDSEKEASSQNPSTAGRSADDEPFRMEVTRETLDVMLRAKSSCRAGFSMVDWGGILQSIWRKMKRETNEKKLPYLSISEIRRHNTPDHLWIVIGSVVYDCTKFQHFHPGGERMLQLCGGRDATELFNYYHRWVSCESMLEPFAVGLVKPEDEERGERKKEKEKGPG
ncbi:hypothetical protein, conserved [Trypanosoma brucei gambiense DAL972]|uniref:Cytochrome b5 heme-binding domain-containing protein n=1 Tax=Trypanosoma brucei gambiense (strain MHOM/CI/86/DAL972) TaxID=679716 RepID=C9ZRS4_TRYB9|nr:hypothetical protein, conserved [Trypanosoma brucei gambiense DAL972]CBH12060.1 hypothetical protein, conserved [Trypanosoma brucei gambiense DAL972]|eukprot:XP_011774343.1 hypothetical protein, conserved [Trypanosoma brucei gambiense DAL972]